MSDASSALEPAGGVAELIGLLTEQCELYGQLFSLGESQRDLITGDDPQRLLSLLGQRQRVLDRLEGVAARMRPFQKGWPGLRGRVSPREAEQVDRLLKRVNGLLAGILERDQADALLLTARRSATSQAMAAVAAGRQAGSAYAAASGGPCEGREWTDR